MRATPQPWPMMTGKVTGSIGSSAPGGPANCAVHVVPAAAAFAAKPS